MKFQDSSFNSLKVTIGTKKCDPPTHARTQAPKAIYPINFFKVGGITTITKITRCCRGYGSLKIWHVHHNEILQASYHINLTF